MADWDKITSAGDVEDRRGFRPLAMGGLGGLGLVGAVIVLIVNLLGGGKAGNLNDVLNQLQQTQATQQQNVQPGQFDGADNYEKFTSAVLGSTNDVWQGIFAKSGKTYGKPKLVLFRSATQSGCGIATSQVGPHYCPADQTIYLDETFFDELQQKFHAKGGDVAQAYVIAHEVGHHVQNELGIMESVQGEREVGGTNQASINLELQADCFAGIWANSVSKEGVIKPGEINEAIDAAAAVGDDRIQKEVQGRINPETWTHGSSEQRVSWFNRGFTSGKPSNCNTFQQ